MQLKMGSEEETKRKRVLNLNWDTLLDEEEPGTLEIVKSKRLDDVQISSNDDDGFDQFSDFELHKKIDSTKNTYQTFSRKLADKGEKLLGQIRRLEAERERRKAQKDEKGAKENWMPSQSTSLSKTGVSDGSAASNTRGELDPAPLFDAKKDDNASSESKRLLCSTSISETGALGGPRLQTSSSYQPHEEPESARLFSETNGTDCSATNAFNTQFSILRQNLSNLNSIVSQQSGRGRRRGRGRSRKSSCVSPNGICSSAYVGRRSQNLMRYFHKEDSSLLPNGSRLPKEPTYVVVDEDEPELADMSEKEDDPEFMEMSGNEDDELPEHLKEAKIYYPSREDPEAIEISYQDIKCLTPGSYLSSNIMNFYIRFLQQEASSTSKTLCNYHFYNTYFYEKLKKVVSLKGCDKEASFVRLRRWWRGVHIFEKAYVLIPIHEEHHWSLVIICMPDKEDDNGPIVLHLDSLGIHNSSVIFDDIRRSYLVEEWNCLKQEVAQGDLPFAGNIWENLPSRINSYVTPVPRQKNDYDCGLFVLYFIERFLHEAPERLQKKDLTMFGRQWFKPEEASGLRKKILRLLKNEFKNASEGKTGSLASQPFQ